MNRSIRNIIVGGFGTGDALAAVEGPGGDVRSIAADDPAIQLAYAQKVVTCRGTRWPLRRPSTRSAGPVGEG
jgi:NAD(P) transhydrogenase subunit beta